MTNTAALLSCHLPLILGTHGLCKQTFVAPVKHVQIPRLLLTMLAALRHCMHEV